MRLPQFAFSQIPNVLILAAIAIIFAGLDAAFVFSGPLLPYAGSTVTIFLAAGAVLLAITGRFTSFRCLYTGFQDEAMVILAGVISGIAGAAGATVDDSLYATALATVMASTVITAALFLLLGTFRLGKIIRYVPFSVTAGFMITVSGLLIVGGIELAESRGIKQTLVSIADYRDLPIKGFTAIGVALWLGLCASRLGQVRALPVGVLSAIASFFLLKLIFDVPLDSLAADQWLMPASGAVSSRSGWEILAGASVDWGVVAGQWSAFVSIALISSLALMLAVTALELSTHQSVDVNDELRAAGLANLCSGALGGSTGYHEDAVTAMLNQNTSSDKMTVLAAAVLCAAVALLDVGWFSFIPIPVLGGLLIWLGWQLLGEWLFRNGRYLHNADWLAVAAIVSVTLYAGFIAGVLLGTGVGIALFLVDYSQVRTVRYAVNGREIRSNIDRSAEAERVLYEHGARIHIIKLQGYLFFARAHQVVLQLEPVFKQMHRQERHFTIIDFHGVAGIDSTATMAFVRLRQMAIEVGAELVFTGLRMEARVDLARIERAGAYIKYFDQFDQGLAYCEDLLLQGFTGDYDARVDASVMFDELLELSKSDSGTSYLRKVHVKTGETLIKVGDAADNIYLVESGSLNVQILGVDQQKITVRGLESGSVFGEMALYLGGTRSASVIATTDAVVQVLNHASMTRMEEEDPRTAVIVHRMLARLLATKLRQTNSWLSHVR